MSQYAAAPDPSLHPAGKTESPVVQLSLRIIRLTRISDAGLNLLVCAIAIFLLGPMVVEVFLEIDLDEAAWTIVFVGFLVLFCAGVVAGIAAWSMARSRFNGAEWRVAVEEARANEETGGALRSGTTMAAAGGTAAVASHVVSGTAPEGSRTENLGDAATLAGSATAVFGIKRWNRAARGVALAVVAAEGVDASSYWRNAGRAAWLVPAAAYLLALVLAIGVSPWATRA